jgi:hypothetical protein
MPHNGTVRRSIAGKRGCRVFQGASATAKANLARVATHRLQYLYGAADRGPVNELQIHITWQLHIPWSTKLQVQRTLGRQGLDAYRVLPGGIGIMACQSAVKLRGAWAAAWLQEATSSARIPPALTDRLHPDEEESAMPAGQVFLTSRMRDYLNIASDIDRSCLPRTYNLDKSVPVRT